MSKLQYFQDYMPENVCFGCGHNPDGLRIKSFWDGNEAICRWTSQEKYHGWSNLMNGGVIATLIDCHCMSTAMADAYRREKRSLDTQPEYRYATGTLTIKYLKPTPNTQVELRACVTEVKGRKAVLTCSLYSENGEKTVEASVVAIRVFDSSSGTRDNPFKGSELT